MIINKDQDKIYVDIGRYSTAYSVVSPNNVIKFFKIESFFGDLTNIFDNPTNKFIERVVNNVRELRLQFKDAYDIIIVIPTKDILLRDGKPITEATLRKTIYDQYKVSSNAGLSQSISRPYKIGTQYFTPVSFYDENIDKLILELDQTGDIGKDRVRGNVIFQTSLYRMIQLAKQTVGRAAIIDSSFSTTRLLLAKDGNPIEYNEFALSGQEMLKYVYSKSKKSIEEIIGIINAYEDAKNNSIKEALDASDYLKHEASKELIPHLQKVKVDKILFTGGLSNTDFLDDLGVEIDYIDKYYYLNDKNLSIPEPVEYKMDMVLTTPIHGGLLDEANLEILIGSRDIDDYSEVSDEDSFLNKDLTVSEIAGNNTALNNNFYVGMSKEIKKNYGIEDNYQKSVQDTLYKESQVTDSEDRLQIINLDSSSSDKEERKKIKIKSVTPDQLELLDTLKNKFKKPSRYEKKTPVFIVAALVAVILFGSLTFLSVMGKINMNGLEAFGVKQPYRIAVEGEISNAVKDRVRHMVRQTEVNGNRIQTIDLNTDNKVGHLKYIIKVPKDMDFKHNVGFYLTEDLKKMINPEIDMKLTVNDEDKLYNMYNLDIMESTTSNGNILNKVKTSGKFEVDGADKWTLEEDRMFFNSEDYQDFINGARNVGDPPKANQDIKETDSSSVGL